MRIPDSDSKDTKSHRVNAVNWINVFASFSPSQIFPVSNEFLFGLHLHPLRISYSTTIQKYLWCKWNINNILYSRSLDTIRWCIFLFYFDLALHLWFTGCKEKKILDKITYSDRVSLVSDNRKFIYRCFYSLRAARFLLRFAQRILIRDNLLTFSLSSASKSNVIIECKVCFSVVKGVVVLWLLSAFYRVIEIQENLKHKIIKFHPPPVTPLILNLSLKLTIEELHWKQKP